DRLVRIVQAMLVDVAQLAQEPGALRLGRGPAQARIAALLQRRGEVDPALLGAEDRLEPLARDRVGGLHAEDAPVGRLRLARASLAGADAGDLGEPGRRLLGAPGAIADLLEQRGQAVPFVVVLGEAVELFARLRLVGRERQRALERLERARHVLGA